MWKFEEEINREKERKNAVIKDIRSVLRKSNKDNSDAHTVVNRINHALEKYGL